MLRNIPACISPDLMHALMSMGHGDEIVLADADFPAATNSKRLIRADGLDVGTLRTSKRQLLRTIRRHASRGNKRQEVPLLQMQEVL